MPDPAQLAALSAIARHGSFDRAAAELHVTPSAISQRIRALEEAVGTMVLRRGPPATATPAGQRLIRHHESVALLEQALAADLPGVNAGPARLRIAVNADSLATWVLPALASVPGFLFDLVIEDQDASQALLRGGEVVAAVTGQPGPVQGCDSFPLGALRYRATASPAFVARHFARGVTPDAILQAPALTFSEHDLLQDRWVAQRAGGRPLPLTSHQIGSSHGFVDACLLGLGWALNPEPLVAGHLAAGRLVDLAPAAPLDVALYWQVTRLSAAGLAPLTAAMRRAALQALITGGQPAAPLPPDA